ncbi:MAG TPA: DUF4145 domain-containing protein [Allosphingosinicella sp.]|jgi:hypothetical protein
MAVRRADPVQPTTALTAFSCPHCGALTTQFWRSAKVQFRSEKNTLPIRFREPEEAKKAFVDTLESAESKQGMSDFIDRVASGLPSIGDKYSSSSQELTNVDVSECYNCHKLAIWVGDRMVWPHANEAPPPNADLPEDVAADYSEAGDIVNASPRGAAALLRLAIQKLCIFLGEPGKNINADIASLVRKGLDPRVQKMLDVVRVIGNNAVHPGEIDLRDDRGTAERLFVLVNMISDIMISQPKAVEEMYNGLGQNALAAIAKRDTPTS